MHTKKQPTITIIALILVISPLFITQAASQQTNQSNEYNQFVHTYISDTQANITYIDKPIFPIMINNLQIQVGANWTISCPLKANHNYHIYCYGTWASSSSTAKTDYDIYIYNPAGSLESSHTEAAGVIEHLNSEGNDALFTPNQSGNYTFLIKNDARESEGAEQATFMIIENIECNQWYTSTVKGKADDSSPNLETTQAYEFTTNESLVEVYINIPSALDMYEARLYLMNDKNSPTINGYCLPTETGLYGNGSSTVGGYNFDTEGSRGVSYASCEYRGEDMFLNYTATDAGTKLYHLVLIGEDGVGDVEFMIKTAFGNITLSPVGALGKVYPDAATKLSFKTSGNPLEQANLTYTIDNWATTELIPMAISNQTCNATIPGQNTGTVVEYRVNAYDTLRNNLDTTGNYTVKAQPTLSLSLAKDAVTVGQNITVTGTLAPYSEDSTVTVQFFSSQNTQSVSCQVLSDGTFTGSFGPDTAGDWGVLANAPETSTSWACDSAQFVVSVKEQPLYMKYSLFIIIGLVVALAVGGVVYYLKFRGS